MKGCELAIKDRSWDDYGFSGGCEQLATFDNKKAILEDRGFIQVAFDIFDVGQHFRWSCPLR